MVRGLAETKSVDVAVVLSFERGDNVSQSLATIREGAAIQNRIGRKIHFKSLQIRGSISNALTTATGDKKQENIRYIIFYDKQPNGVAATWNQIIQSTYESGSTASLANDFPNTGNRDRFIILRDKTITMGATRSASVIDQEYQAGAPYGTWEGNGETRVQDFVKLNGMECQFNGTASPATVALINTGNIGVVVQGLLGSNSPTGMPQWKLAFTSRLTFVDA